MQKELVSIIIPVYNVKKYLNKCLQSVINQTYTKLEIILVDDGSKDESGKICDEWRKKDNRIKVIHKKNGGVSSARNKGLSIATGKYIIFIDSDDYADEHLIEKLVDNIKKTDSDLSVCSFFYVDNQNVREYTGNNLLKIMNRQTFLDNITKRDYKGYLWNKLFRKDKIDNLKFDENKKICEDLLFVIQYVNNCEKICYIDDLLYYYVLHDDSATSSFDVSKRYNQIITMDEIIEFVKENELSCIFYEFESDMILIGMNLKYWLKKSKTNENKQKIKKIDEIVEKYKKDGCIKHEKKLFKKAKLFLCLNFNYLYQFIKNIKVVRE